VVAGGGDAPHAIEVADDGPGIARDLLDRVFEPFVSSGHATEGRDYGLGLAIVRSIAEEAGGGAEVELPGVGGTIVRVRLPAVSAPPLRPPTPERTRVAEGAEVAMVGPADYARSLIADGLRDAGLIVREFPDTERLAAAMRSASARPEAVLMAAVAAGERPSAALDAIRAAGCDAPFILIVAPSDEQDAPPDAILLRKPVTVGVVRDAVRRAVAQRGASTQRREGSS
jgi:CheY-like chemotaxis protein